MRANRVVKSGMSAVVVITLALGFSACGKSEDTGFPAGNNNGLNGGIYAPVTTCGGTTPPAFLMNSESGPVAAESWSYIINPDTPCDPRSAGTHLYVKAGDKVTVTFDANNVMWGYSAWSTSSDTLWGFIPYYKSSWKTYCDRVSAAGVDRSTGSALPTYKGKAVGLVISDGQNVYEAGTSGMQITMLGAGYLRIGFNIPYDVQFPCGKTGSVTLTVTRI